MNYVSIVKADIANGDGFRVSLFVSGCLRNCPGCFNKQAQDPAFGKFFDEEAKKKNPYALPGDPNATQSDYFNYIMAMNNMFGGR